MAEAEESRKNIHPLIYRVYRQTVQRVNVSIKNLNSHAAFLIVVEEDKQVIAWIGSQCDADDTELANNIGETILRKDFREMDEEEIPNIVEGSEPSELLEVVLDVFWSNVGVYFSKASAKDRRKPLTNSSVSVGLLEPVSWAADVYDFQETAFAHPDSHGTVPRVSFVPIEMETVAYVNIGDHWDVWFARAVPEKEIEKVMEFIRNTVANQLSLADNTFTRQNDVLAQYIFMVRQGEEGTLFRRPLKIFTDYEPPGKCAPRPEPAPRVKKGKVKAKTPSITSADAEPAVDLGGSAGADKGPLEDKAKKSLTIDPNLPPDAPDSTSAGAAPANFWAPVKNETNPNDVVLGAPPAFGNSVVQLGETGVLSNETVEIDDKDGLFGLDVDIITPGMLKVVETENENPEKRQATIDRSVTDPKHLIGYQVEIDDGVYAGVFVVTQVKKNLFKKTLFHLTALDRDEFWIRLKRNKKSGTPFRYSLWMCVFLFPCPLCVRV